ncbi:hypothetical protein ACFXG6_24010 [Streptomyces roseus]|uniref:hypothetical protein n=1 Tax=Streptomyces roseus TaxID=66430 RepID=UPI0036783723
MPDFDTASALAAEDPGIRPAGYARLFAVPDAEGLGADRAAVVQNIPARLDTASA